MFVDKSCCTVDEILLLLLLCSLVLLCLLDLVGGGGEVTMHVLQCKQIRLFLVGCCLFVENM